MYILLGHHGNMLLSPQTLSPFPSKVVKFPDATTAAAAAGQPFDGRAHLEGGAELHAEPAGEVLLGQEGERAAVDALLSKGLEEDGRKIQLDCLSIK